MTCFLYVVIPVVFFPPTDAKVAVSRSIKERFMKLTNNTTVHIDQITHQIKKTRAFQHQTRQKQKTLSIIHLSLMNVLSLRTPVGSAALVTELSRHLLHTHVLYLLPLHPYYTVMSVASPLSQVVFCPSMQKHIKK